jgi:hypothetical protein
MTTDEPCVGLRRVKLGAVAALLVAEVLTALAVLVIVLG